MVPFLSIMTRTVRDQIWSAIIEQLVIEGEFRVSDLGLDESKNQTIRRVCREMEKMGYLTRDSKRSKTWKAGERADLHLNLSMRAKVNAGFDE
jgi:hypothetical protein